MNNATGQRKKVDPRVRSVLQQGIANNHRSFFVIVGDKGRDQVVNLHLFLSKARVTARPSVLWCYKKDLGFSSHRKKRIKQIKRQVERGQRDPDTDDPFELFISSTDIRYTYYKETHKVLGQTFGMCVLQDFEAVTPNILARTIETVEGGGIVVLLLKTMKSLKQLYTMTMDVHSRYRTEAHGDVTARFNERFILSLGGCETCLVVDDELNVLPISMGKDAKPTAPLPPPPTTADGKPVPSADAELMEIVESLKDTQPVGALVSCARTVDQAKAILTFVEAVSEKTLRSTVTLTAARGRGKSAALGLAMATAIAYGYSNIFVTSPSPENLKTLFEFVFKGFDALGYEEHLDYDLVQSTNPDFNKAIVRVNVFRNHRQTIQYIQPQDAHVLGQAELVVIDEAAAIPLPLVRQLLGPYLVFMASTINGYEGTGRSLSLKLIQQLREQSMQAAARTLREIALTTPIRYGANDPVEKWLNQLLCLDATVSKSVTGCPHPSTCSLYYVHRDTLFSYHPISEVFLQRMMALYVSSHYKNSPNDLQLMSDAPAHHLFVLLPPIAADSNTLPEPLVVVQVCLEGEISKQTIANSLARGLRADGDLIPWCISQQYQDDEFAQLSGARVVRIATHPDYSKMGYGTRALELLEQYYVGSFENLSEPSADNQKQEALRAWDMKRTADVADDTSLQTDLPKVRSTAAMPPLLLKLSERRPERLHWLGVSYGLTPQLHKFWKRAQFVPLYVRQTANELTGEHTCVMIKELNKGVATAVDVSWVDLFARDFTKRFCRLLGYEFSKFTCVMAQSILEAAQFRAGSGTELDSKTLLDHFGPHDLKRLESYSAQMLDYHVIMDLVPLLSELYYAGRTSRTDVELSGLQCSMLLGMGLQKKSVDALEKEFGLPGGQIMALFLKMMRKFSWYFNRIETAGIREERARPSERAAAENVVDAASDDDDDDDDDDEPTQEDDEGVNSKRDVHEEAAWDPLVQDMHDDLNAAGSEVMRAMSERQRELIQAIDVARYAIGGEDKDWETAQSRLEARGGLDKSGMTKMLSVANANSHKATKRKMADESKKSSSRGGKKQRGGRR
ncbi:N-acetyltransferase 10 [Sorochytrium milnesiophthora]